MVMNVDVEIAGNSVSGIDGEEYNKKWATVFGVRKYNKDAFIVIKNQTVILLYHHNQTQI